MSPFARTATVLLIAVASTCFPGQPVLAADDCCLPLASADSPVRYFDGSSFAFTEPCQSISCYPGYPPIPSSASFSTSYYTPGYYSRAYAPKIVPPDFRPRYTPPWPYFYTPAGDYTPGYYSYYYTPGYFRY